MTAYNSCKRWALREIAQGHGLSVDDVADEFKCQLEERVWNLEEKAEALRRKGEELPDEEKEELKLVQDRVAKLASLPAYVGRGYEVKAACCVSAIDSDRWWN